MKFISFLIFTFFSCQSFGQTDSLVGQGKPIEGWTFIGEVQLNEKLYIQSNYVTKEGSKIKIWVKTRLLKPLVVKGVSYNNAERMTLWIFDCQSKQVRLAAMHGYASGQILFGQQVDEDIWQDVIPDTEGQRMMDAVCSRFYK